MKVADAVTFGSEVVKVPHAVIIVHLTPAERRVGRRTRKEGKERKKKKER